MFEQQLAKYIKTDSKSVHSYVRSKQLFPGKAGPFENNTGSLIPNEILN